MEFAGAIHRTRLAQRADPHEIGRLHVITDRRNPLAIVEAALSAGVSTIQVRVEKNETDRHAYELTTSVVRRCRASGARCLVNDRIHIAMAVGADGVHIGADDVPVRAARRLLGPHAIVGATARDPRSARQAVADGADYLGVGPVFTTSTKDGLPDPLGPQGIKDVVEAVPGTRVIAIGGVTAANASALMATGAYGVAVVGAVSRASDPYQAARALLAVVAPHVVRDIATPQIRKPERRRSTIAVIGAGIIGLSVAWRCAQLGYPVTVFDENANANASRVAAGMLAPDTEVHFGETETQDLLAVSAKMWPDFAAQLVAETGIDVGHRTEGTLFVGVGGDDLAEVRRLTAYHAKSGRTVQALSRDELRIREPLLSPRIRGGAFAAEDHQVVPRKVLRALEKACAARNIDIQEKKITDLSTVDAEITVVATGCDSAQLAGVAVRPVKGEILRLRRDPHGPPPLRHVIRAYADSVPIYIVPRLDGEVVVGATAWERSDNAVSVGGVTELLRTAIDVVPALAEYELAEIAVGFRPVTPDNVPIVHRRDDGTVIATGHGRNGILLAPWTADTVTDLVRSYR